MSKYFVQRLPLQGDIKVGDKIRSESFSKSAVSVTKVDDNTYWTDELDIADPMGQSFFGVSKSKAVRLSNELFLCSRDIHVGDGILVDGFPHIKPTKVVNIEITNPDHSIHIPVYNCENGDWYELHEIFKLIGKMSPYAVWVKEGDEFIEEDLRWAIVDEYGDRCFLKEMSSPSEYDYIMAICPTCQTFH